MQRRQFLAASLAASAAAFSRSAEAQTPAKGAGEFYQIRKYQLQTGPQTKLTESYFADALIPALKRMGMGPIGAFRMDFGPETPAYYALIPGPSIEALAMLDLRLSKDEVFVKAAEPFWSAPATATSFLRVDVSLLSAFEGWPKLVVPPLAVSKSKRILQLRTYESPSDADHVRKVEMFNSGEFAIFQKAGCNPVFFADTLVGRRMPNLTYMLSFPNLEALDAGWAAFISDPGWKKLSSEPRYTYEQIVSDISNLILSPLAASEI